MSIQFFVDLGYLVGALAFVTGLRRLSSPDTARRGNIIAACGMGLAIVASFFHPLAATFNNYIWIFGGMIVGGSLGYLMAKRVKMTEMPQLVSLFNGFGGACAVLLASTEAIHIYSGDKLVATGELLIIVLTLIIGAISFTGSMLAFAKLDGRVDDRKVTFKNHQLLNYALSAILVALTIWMVIQGNDFQLVIFVILAALALIYGFSFVAPIGGADMPVVISLLNSLTGLSAAAAGLIYNNQIMLIGGILVGASGTILTILMCQAMNRSLWNVIIGGFGSSGAAVGRGEAGAIKEITANDAAILLYYADTVVFVPGYGLAVAQAQKACKELDDLLEANGVEVRYGIHPVAGRMPGHMNVLLAEADVPYPKLLDLDDANSTLSDATVAVIVGANDVVNPAAETDKGSPIYGMPVLKVWEAKNVIVMKRTMASGYAGIQNPLFFHDRTRMLFGDAKASIQNLIQEVKELG